MNDEFNSKIVPDVELALGQGTIDYLSPGMPEGLPMIGDMKIVPKRKKRPVQPYSHTDVGTFNFYLSKTRRMYFRAFIDSANLTPTEFITTVVPPVAEAAMRARLHGKKSVDVTIRIHFRDKDGILSTEKGEK